MSEAKDEKESEVQEGSEVGSTSGSEDEESGPPQKRPDSSSSSSPTAKESVEKPGEAAKVPDESSNNVKHKLEFTSSSGEASEGHTNRQRSSNGSSSLSSERNKVGANKLGDSKNVLKESTSVEGSNEQSSSPHDDQPSVTTTSPQKEIVDEPPPIKTTIESNNISHKHEDDVLVEESEKSVAVMSSKSQSISEGSSSKKSRGGSSNSGEKGAKVGGSSLSKIPTRLGVPLVGPPFESGANTEAIQLLRQLWNVHEEAVGFLKKIRSLLSTLRQELRSHENAFEFSLRGKRSSTTPSIPPSKLGDSQQVQQQAQVKPKRNESGSGGGGRSGEVGGGSSEETKKEWWAPLPRLVEGLTCIYDSFADIETQFVSLSVFQSQCKLSLLAKVKNAKHQVTHDRLSIMHGVQQLITATLQLISTPSMWVGMDDHSPVSNVFHLTEVFNACVESSWSSLPMEAALAASSVPPSQQPHRPPSPSVVAPNSNPAGSVTSLTPSADEAKSVGGGSSDPSKPSTSSLPNRLRVLVQINAANRNDSALLRLSLKPLSATRLLQLVARKRSTFASHSFSRITLANFNSTPSSGDVTAVLTPEKYESVFSEEDSGLSPLAKGFSERPSLLGRAAVKKTENGDQRLSRSAKLKMVSYFHQVLWTLAGEHSEDLLLWGIQSTVLPLLLQPLQSFVSLRNALSLGQQFQQSHLSPMLSAFDAVGGALHSFTLLASWDEKIREAFEETHRVKRPEHVALLSRPTPKEWATEIGEKFGQIVTTCVTLIDGDGVKGVGMRSSLPPSDEEHLGDEAQTLFRLEATLIYFKTWIVKRAKVWLNAWAIPQFMAFSQREPALLVSLIKSREPLLITRDFLLNNENVSIRLIAKHRQSCANDLRQALLQLQTMPDEMLQAVGPVCNTLSLATLQSYMPPAPHWRGVGRSSGLDPDKPSSYIKIFIERVIEPVITASVELVPGPVQEAMGKQTVHAACDAWLEYILQRKIKFSEWGAVQLLRDFTAFREWIRTETQLEKEARRAILQLEVLRRCEGVAYLLLRNPGDVLGVGKPARKNRRIAPSSSGSVDSSPSAADSTAEDDIPPEMYVPNQQMWLELRLRRSMFTSPCCQ